MGAEISVCEPTGIDVHKLVGADVHKPVGADIHEPTEAESSCGQSTSSILPFGNTT